MAPIDDLKSGVVATNEGPFVVLEPCPVCHGQGAIN